MLDEIQQILMNPYPMVCKWKGNNRAPVIGYFLTGVPEEIIHAGGAYPLEIWGTIRKTSDVDAMLPNYVCSPVKSCLESTLRGDLNFIDFMLIPYLCDTTREFIHVWNEEVPGIKADSFRIPKKTAGPEAFEFLLCEMNRLREMTEILVEKAITESDLRKSIAIYNHNRRLLREIHGYWLAHPGSINNTQMYALLESASIMRKEEHNKFLEEFSAQLYSGKPVDQQDVIRLFIKGKILEPAGILDIFDQLKVQIVGDDFVRGFRSISEDPPEDIDPMKALVKRHLSLPPYQGFHYERSQVHDYLSDAVRKANAHGVIFLSQSFCEPAAFAEPDLKKVFDGDGIPTISIQTTRQKSSLSQVALRIEAFVEMLRNNNLS